MMYKNIFAANKTYFLKLCFICIVFRGGCNKSEIIPLEPDRDNAREGIRRKALLFGECTAMCIRFQVVNNYLQQPTPVAVFV